MLDCCVFLFVTFAFLLRFRFSSFSSPWCIFGKAEALKNFSHVRSDASVYLCWAAIPLLVRASSFVPGGGEFGLTLIALERLVLGLACTNVLVVIRLPWCRMPKDHGIGCLPSASLARFALCHLAS